MIRAEELMIGDWVMSIHPAVPRPVRVTEIGANDIGYKNGILSISFLEPIPITPEILEKNGFYFGYTSSMEDSINNIPHDIPVVIPEKTWCYDEGDGEITIDFPTESDGGLICVSYADKYMELIFDDVVFLHELQHALRLCGIAKEIFMHFMG